MLLKVALLFAGTILAFWISAICGGGASMILIPALNLLLPGSVVPFSLTVGTFTSSVSRIAVFKKHIQWKIFWWFVPFSIPAVLLGAWLLKFVNPLHLQFVVALFLITNVLQLFQTKDKLHKAERPYPQYVLAIVGFFAGFVSGVTGAIGLLFNRFYLNYGLSKEEIIATRAANEIFLHLIKLAIYIALGLYSTDAIWLGVVIAVASILSSVSVKYILPYISEFIFKKLGYGTMVLSGVVLLMGTSEKLIYQDNLHISTAQVGDKKETTINWRESNLVLEYAFDDGLEMERPVSYSELPESLQHSYNDLMKTYDEILIEKVYRLGEPNSYELYCYKGRILTKLEFKDVP